MNENLNIITERIDDVPLLLKQLETMGVARLIDEHFPRHGHWQGLSPGEVVAGWLAFIVSEANHRLSHVQAWAAERLRLLGASFQAPVRELDFSDDRLGRVLDQLSDDGRWEGFETALTGQTLRVYELAAEQVRLDSTSAKSYAAIDPEGLFQLGHSKDHRPDLAQVKINLSVLDPLGLPLTTTVVAGQRADDGLYVPEMARVQRTLGRRGVSYVGDSKMAALATRAYAVDSGDYYLCPLSERQLSASEREQLLTPVWTGEQVLEMIYRPNPEGAGAEEIAEGFEYDEHQQAELDGQVVSWTERRLVVRSLKLASSQEQQLRQRTARACAALLKLNERGRGNPRFCDAAPLREAVEALVAKHRVAGLVTVCYHRACRERTVRAYAGKPARIEYEYDMTLSVTLNEAALAGAARRLGWQVYATNHPAEQLSLAQAVLAYRSQYLIERGFGRFKGERLALTPLHLNTDARVTGLIRLLSIALRVLTLVEFKVRQGLQQHGEMLAGLYPGNPKRATAQPTTEMVLRAFVGLTLTVVNNATQVQRHVTPLKPLQQRILQLLDFPHTLYEKLAQQLFEPVINLREP